MSLPTLNASMLGRIVTWAYADANQETDLLANFGKGWGSWGQGSWFSNSDAADTNATPDNVCGSSFCIAGQAAAQVGMAMVVDSTGSATYCGPRVFDGLDESGKPRYIVEETEAIRDVAQKALGLTEREADTLFNGGNNIEQVIAYAMLFAEVRGVALDLPGDALSNGYAYWESGQGGSRFDDVFYLGPDTDTTYRAAAERLGWTEPVRQCYACGHDLP